MIENRIKEYRSDRGMTQTELAKLVGVRRETIYNFMAWEMVLFLDSVCIP